MLAVQENIVTTLGSNRCWRSSSGRSWWRDSGGSVTVDLDLVLGALARNVPGLTTAVASLSSGVQWTTVRSGAVARNVTELATGVALHGLSLAVTGKVVWTTAFVAGSGAVDRGETATKRTAIATTGCRTTTAGARSSSTSGTWSWASTLLGVSDHEEDWKERSTYGNVTDLAAGVAATASWTTAQTKSWAVSLNVAKTLAVVALLGLGGAWVRAVVGLVALYLVS